MFLKVITTNFLMFLINFKGPLYLFATHFLIINLNYLKFPNSTPQSLNFIFTYIF